MHPYIYCTFKPYTYPLIGRELIRRTCSSSIDRCSRPSSNDPKPVALGTRTSGACETLTRSCRSQAEVPMKSTDRTIQREITIGGVAFQIVIRFWMHANTSNTRKCPERPGTTPSEKQVLWKRVENTQAIFKKCSARDLFLRKNCDVYD